ncbi:hypothetical protein JXQ70_05870 [bacterium]|nr:hypothetical protein [bacterium]
MPNFFDHNNQTGPSLAYFVTPHGFGHAARAAAVMQALHQLKPDLKLTIISTIPDWFFRESLSGRFEYYPALIDVGFVQHNPVREDLKATLTKLEQLFPVRDSLIDSLVHICTEQKIQVIVCDISPVAVMVGPRLGIPTILVENFTWDWIYSHYLDKERGFAHFTHLLEDLYARFDYRVQTEPISHRQTADLRVPPIARTPRSSRLSLRKRLRIEQDLPIVLITMGGVPWDIDFVAGLREYKQAHFIIAGTLDDRKYADHITFLPAHSEFYHPDLVHSCDVVIGKLGYSTVAEVYTAGIPFGYIPREHFPESDSMVAFVQRNLDCCPLTDEDFIKGRWIERLPFLLSARKHPPTQPNGSDHTARFILKILSSG